MVATSKVKNDNEATLVGSGMYISIRFEPKDVSFSQSVLGEGEAEDTCFGSIWKHPKNQWPMGEGDVVNGTALSGLWPDRASWFNRPLGSQADALVWNIPFGYYDLSKNLTPITANELLSSC